MERKTSGVLQFLGGIEMEYWRGQKSSTANKLECHNYGLEDSFLFIVMLRRCYESIPHTVVIFTAPKLKLAVVLLSMNCDEYMRVKFEEDQNENRAQFPINLKHNLSIN